jgi:hypothetical protein
MRRILFLVLLSACGDNNTGATLDTDTECTVESRNVSGTPVDMVMSAELQIDDCQSFLIRNNEWLTATFGGQPPAELAGVDFTVDRIVLGWTNPAIKFVVDDGTQLVVGQQGSCDGGTPRCVALVVRSTRDTMTVDSCPYIGSNPCK